MADLHKMVIHNTGEMVRRPPVTLKNDKVVRARRDGHGLRLPKDDVRRKSLLLCFAL